ncbi:Hypothetical_protein [Hexamita inflata]|uniref:Hypothetical_protein n=1 Tax=Hexamita inflata TaxID=28002 RepID=A0ABP1HX32_9EUKA
MYVKDRTLQHAEIDTLTYINPKNKHIIPPAKYPKLFSIVMNITTSATPTGRRKTLMNVITRATRGLSNILNGLNGSFTGTQCTPQFILFALLLQSAISSRNVVSIFIINIQYMCNVMIASQITPSISVYLRKLMNITVKQVQIGHFSLISPFLSNQDQESILSLRYHSSNLLTVSPEQAFPNQ